MNEEYKLSTVHKVKTLSNVLYNKIAARLKVLLTVFACKNYWPPELISVITHSTK